MIRTIFLAIVAVAAVTYAMILKQDMNERDKQIAQLGRDLAAARDAATKAITDADAARHEVTGLNDNIARLTAERDAARAKSKENGASGVAVASDGQAPNAGEKPANPMSA